MKDVLLTLLSLSLSGSLLAVILLAVRRVVGGRLPKAFWYYAWLLVLLRLAVPVGLGIRLPQPVPAAPEGTRQEAVLPEAPDQAEQAAPAAGTGTPVAPVQPHQAPPPPERSLSPTAVLSALWLLGAAGFFLWHLAAYGRFARRVGRSLVPPPPEALALFEPMAKGRRVRLAASDQVDTPMLIGLLRPVVVLPLGQPVGAAVLRHELTHCRRYDVLYKWLVVLVTALHWFNPLVHWMGRRMALDCELSCDEAVLSALPPEERVDYGELLLGWVGNDIWNLDDGYVFAIYTLAEGQPVLAVEGWERSTYVLGEDGFLYHCGSSGAGRTQWNKYRFDSTDPDFLEEVEQVSEPENGQEAVAVGDAWMASGVSIPCTTFASPEGVYQDVLLGNTSLLYWAEGAEEPVPRTVAEIPALFSPYSSYARIGQFGVLDLDGDGSEEVVLWVTDVANDMGGYLVLHQEDGGISGYPSHWRTFEDLKTDGTFKYSYPAGNEGGVASVRFTGTGLDLDKHICGQGRQFEFSTFLVDGKPVSETAYNAAWDAQDQKPDTVWYPWNEDNIRAFT